MVKKSKTSETSAKAGRSRNNPLTPSSPKAGVTGKRTKYGCGGKLK